MTLIPNICTWISKGHIGMRIVVVFLFVLVAFGAGFMLLTRSPDEPASEAPTSLALMRDEAASKKLIDRNEVPGDGRPKTKFKPSESANSEDRGFDATIQSWTAMDLCDDPSLSKQFSTRELIEHYKASAAGKESVVSTTELLRARLCGSWNGAGAAHDREDVFDFLSKNSIAFQDTAVFVDLLENRSDPAVSHGDITDFVVDKIRNINSKYEFLETMTLLNQTSAPAIGLARFGYPSGIQKDAADYAAMVAACRIIGGCSQYDAFSVRLCFLVCDHPMSAEEYARASIAPRESDVFERAVDAIVAARVSRGDAAHP